jgi:hypothetical protein
VTVPRPAEDVIPRRRTVRRFGIRRLRNKNLRMRELDVTADRVAHNQSVFREANEGIETSAEEIGVDARRLPFICECPDRHCTSLTRLSLLDYDRVRSNGRWFLVVPGHETCVVDGEDVARVYEQTADFSIMAKIGRAGEVAEDLDPRA